MIPAACRQKLRDGARTAVRQGSRSRLGVQAPQRFNVSHDSSRRTVMNALKNVLFFGLLVAVLFGVYISLSKQPEQQPLPPGITGDTTPPKIDVPDFGA